MDYTLNVEFSAKGHWPLFLDIGITSRMLLYASVNKFQMQQHFSATGCVDIGSHKPR